VKWSQHLHLSFHCSMATIEEQNEIAIKALQFKNKVNSIIEDEEERSKLFDALRNYLETKKVKRLVRELKLVLDNSKKYPLFKEIRAFIESEHLFAFDKLTEGARTGERIVHLKRHGTEPLGFKFKGGLEHNIGIYVTSIVPGSAAHFSGLRVGDEILKVNGFVLHESIHDEVVNVLKNKKSLTFVTKNMGKIPNKVNNRIVWQEVDPNMHLPASGIWDQNFVNHAPGSPKDSSVSGNDDKLVALKVGKDGLGCSIRSGIESFTGVFISAVSPNQLAEQVGLRVGDQILQVNGRIFDNIQHSEAVNALKARKELTMIVRHNEEVSNYLLKKSTDNNAIKPILIMEDQEREIQKHASFGEEPVIQYIEPLVLSEEEEMILKNEMDNEEATPQVGEGNYQFDEDVTQGKEVHMVSILKTAPLMLDLEMKNDLVVVRSATKGGAASDNGFLKRGDVLLNVEGVDLVGLDAAEAQEAISEAMGRLSHHIDLVVACSVGRKPPDPQNIDTFFEELYSSKGNQPDADDVLNQALKDENGKKSIVTKFIAQFESQSRKTSAFLLRRDSLEKARNSLRLYKTNKSRSSLYKVIHPGHEKLSKAIHPGHEKTLDASPSESLLLDSSQFTGIANSQSADSSPDVNRKSAFAMHDPTPVNIASTSASKQKWQSAVRRVSEGRIGPLQAENVEEKSPESGPYLTTSKAEVPAFGNSNGVHKSADQVHQANRSNQANHSTSNKNGRVSDSTRGITVSQNNSDLGPKEGNVLSRKSIGKDGSSLVNVPSHTKANDDPLSSNQHKVQALVHSPPISVSSDDMISTWAPTSPPRGYSSSENLLSRKSVAFEKHGTEFHKKEIALPSKFKSKSMDELNERVEKFHFEDVSAHERRANLPRKKSVGFKETVERIEPSSFKSMDDISMIGRQGWDERMSNVEQLSRPRKSALRNSPSPLNNGTSSGADHDQAYSRHSPPGSEMPAPGQYSNLSREDFVRSSAAKPSSSKGDRLMPRNSLDDDPKFNEEIDRLASSVEKSFVVPELPEPDYDGATGNTHTQVPPLILPPSTKKSPSVKSTSAKQQPTKEKKKDVPFGVSNKLLNSAKDKLKRVGFRRSSHTPTKKESQETADKNSEPSKPSPPTAKSLLAKPPAPPPPPPLPQASKQASVHSSNLSQSASSLPVHQAATAQQSQSSPHLPVVSHLSDRPTFTSQSPPALDSSLSNMILNSPVRKAATTRDFNELEKSGFKKAWEASDAQDGVDINRSMDAAMASAVTEDVKIASVLADNGSGARPKSFKREKMIDMTDVLSELKMKSNKRKQRPISVHSEMPSAYDSSYSKDYSSRMETSVSARKESADIFNYGRSSIESSPSRTDQDPRESRISRRQARSVADIDSDSLDLSLSGVASNPVTPRSARSLTSLDARESALLEMEGTLKEFDEVIQSLDTEL